MGAIPASQNKNNKTVRVLKGQLAALFSNIMQEFWETSSGKPQPDIF